VKHILSKITKGYVQSLNRLISGNLDEELIDLALQKPELNHFSPELLMQNPNSDFYKTVVGLARENVIERILEEIAVQESFLISEIKRQFKLRSEALAEYELDKMEKFCDALARYYRIADERLTNMKKLLVHHNSTADLLKDLITPTDKEFIAFREEHFFKPLREKIRQIETQHRQEVHNDIEHAVTNNPENLSILAEIAGVDENTPQEQIVDEVTDVLSNRPVSGPLSKVFRTVLNHNEVRPSPHPCSMSEVAKAAQANAKKSNEDSSESDQLILTEEQELEKFSEDLGISLEMAKQKRIMQSHLLIFQKQSDATSLLDVIKKSKKIKNSEGEDLLGSIAKKNVEKSDRIYQAELEGQKHFNEKLEEHGIKPTETQLSLSGDIRPVLQQTDTGTVEISEEQFKKFTEATKAIKARELLSKLDKNIVLKPHEEESLIHREHLESERKALESGQHEGLKEKIEASRTVLSKPRINDDDEFGFDDINEKFEQQEKFNTNTSFNEEDEFGFDDINEEFESQEELNVNTSFNEKDEFSFDDTNENSDKKNEDHDSQEKKPIGPQF